MSKLSFRARALDPSKPMPIYMAEELPDLPDYSAINRTVPQMPSGMEKEEECEHHLQRAICAGLIIPTPEVTQMEDAAFYDKLYPSTYKQPRQLIHMQPFAMEQDIPDYDMDSEDERWLMSQAKKLDIKPLKFEEMMDRLEKSSGQTVVTINEAKALLKEDDDLIIAVFDYWLNKRLKTQHPLILTVKTEQRAGSAPNNPYLAFRRRTEKMQTRKNRKNDETSYEKMLKLRRDLSRAVTLLELVKRREKTKREYVHLTVEIFEKRYQARDFSGALVAEVASVKRPAFTQLFQNHYTGNQAWAGNKATVKDEITSRKEKRQYKKRKHKGSHIGGSRVSTVGLTEGLGSSDDEEMLPEEPVSEEAEEEGPFAFRRNKLCNYHMPITNSEGGNWPWCSRDENGLADKRYRYTLTSLSNPRRCIGFARRRVGRGGRIILDRLTTDYDDLWRAFDWTIMDNADDAATVVSDVNAVKKTEVVSATTTTDYLNKRQHNSRTNPLNTVLDSDTLNVISESDVAGADYAKTTVVNAANIAVKQERMDVDEVSATSLTEVAATTASGDTQQQQEEKDREDMLEFLKEVRREWLHFRPKTPPPNYSPPCYLIPVEDETEPLVFIPTPSTTVTMEVQELGVDLLDTSSSDGGLFTTTPFSLDDLYPSSIGDWSQATVDTTPFGCSRFNVMDNSNDSGGVTAPTTPSPLLTPTTTSILSSTLTSPKLNSVVNSAAATGAATNGPLKVSSNHKYLLYGNAVATSSAVTSRARGNKMHQNAYNTSTRAGASTPQSPRPALSAHTLTLNSHSANILDLPSLTNCDTDTNSATVAAATKLNLTEGNGNGTATSTTPNNKNNKQQTIVRKTNLVMEVT